MTRVARAAAFRACVDITCGHDRDFAESAQITCVRNGDCAGSISGISESDGAARESPPRLRRAAHAAFVDRVGIPGSAQSKRFDAVARTLSGPRGEANK